MNTDQREMNLERLAARLAELEQANGRMEEELAALRAEQAAARERLTGHVPVVAETSGPTSRRGLLRTALGVAAATAGAGALLEASGGKVAAANGGAVILGATNLEETGTQVKWDGASGFTGVLLLGNDTGFSNSGAFFPAAAGGWAGGGVAGVPHGVYGFTQASPTSSVTPTAVAGVATQGTGVHGATQSSSISSIGVEGVSPSGIGVSGTSTNGTGVSGAGGSNSPGVGVSGTGATGVVATGGQIGLSASGSLFGVSANGKSIGVAGSTTASSGTGVQGLALVTGGIGVTGQGNLKGISGSSPSGYGGYFSGGAAPLHLAPTTTSGPPTTGAHKQGDLMVDNAGVLFICTAAGTPGTWVKVGTQA